MDLLPDHILIEILSYLSLKEVIRLETVSKSFVSIYKSSPIIIYNFLRIRYKSPFFPNDNRPLYSEVKRLSSRLNHTKERMVQMLAYYTDGGLLKPNPYDSMITVFSSNFFDRCYSAKRNNNVLVKAIFCGSDLKYSTLRSAWERKGLAKISNTADCVVDLKELRSTLEQILKNLCKDLIITEFCIEIPSTSYKAPFKSCIIFRSTEYTEQLEVVRMFEGCDDMEKALDISRQLDFPVYSETNGTYQSIRFDECKGKVQPVLWLSFFNVIVGSEIVRIRVKSPMVGSYIYILFIDSFSSDHCNSIDIGTFISKGKILQFIN